MKSLARIVTAGALLMLLQACELGSGSPLGTTSVSADGGTAFSLTNLQSIAPAFIESFTLTGSDTSGVAWTGSFSVQNLPPATFNGTPATPRVETLALTNTQTNAQINTQQTLYLGAGFQILGLVNNITGVSCVPQGTFATLPVTAGIGQSGVLGTLSCSDGTRRAFSWREDGSSLTGLGTLVLVDTTLNAAGAQLATDEQGYVMDSAGAIHGVTLFNRDITAGTALTLQSPVT